MKKIGKRNITKGIMLLIAFAIWTAVVMLVDVQPVGVNGTNIGLAGINTWFHNLTGVHMNLYEITDKWELIAIVICACFGVVGLVQWIKRKNILKVDADIIALGIYYIIVICAFVFFSIVPINYRPILIEGAMEASYPSSTTLLVLSVMPTLVYQIKRRIKSKFIQAITAIFSILFSLCIVIERLISGVHWLTDIIGSVFLSFGVYLIYKGIVQLMDQKKLADKVEKATAEREKAAENSEKSE